ncbi:MAG: LPS export ABC transporter periplasmic protein LptC [Alphaproteobacteria bacterium]|nr:LPS export ABC transporter periplasmic protein LptC [Alphaproteobacteria bacterium]
MSDDNIPAQPKRPSVLFNRSEQATPQPTPRRKPVSFILLGGAILIAGGMVGLSSIFQTQENLEIDITSLSATPTGSLEMTGARYSGRTLSGNFFSITADRAVEDANNKETMHLFNPDGTFERDGRGTTHLLSKEGFYNANADTIELFGAVRVHRDIQNLTLLTERMEANIGSGTLLAPTAVEVTSPDMHVTAEGMQAYNHGEHIIFTGNPRAVFISNTQQTQ